MISGRVMNGPTPIISIMFSVVACANPMPRTSSTPSRFELPCDGGPGGCSAELAGLMAYTQQIHVESNRSRHPERQLSEESIPSVDVMAFAVLRQQETAFLRLLARIVARQYRCVVRIPLIHEVQTAFLHPAIEVGLRDGVGVVEDRTLRIQNRDRRLLDGDAFAAKLGGIRRVVAVVEVAGRS